MEHRWYVIHVMSGYEKTVAAALKSRIAMADKGLSAQFGDILVPTEDIIEMRGDKRRRAARKLFPGYVLVQMDVDEHSWHLVKKTPHVMRFIGGQSDAPSPISEREVERILGRIKRSGDKPQPKTQFEVGEAIRIVGRPLQRLQRQR